MSTKPPGPAAPGAGAPARTRRERARSVGLILLAVVMTVFAVLNLKGVQVNWIVGSGEAPLIVVIVLSFLAGVVITYFVERRSRRRE